MLLVLPFEVITDLAIDFQTVDKIMSLLTNRFGHIHMAPKVFDIF